MRIQSIRPLALVILAGYFLHSDQLAYADARLPGQIVPTEQSINLKLDARERGYTGSTRIALSVKETTSSFQFHAEGLSIDVLSLEQAGRVVPTTTDIGEWELVTVTTQAPLAAGTATLSIEFSNTFDSTAMSLYRMEADGEAYCFTQFEADEARGAFPCWDEPVFKIPFQLTISVPESHIAIANTPVENEIAAEGWRTYEFKKSSPMPSYLLAIATGPLELVPIKGMSVPGSVVCVKGKTHLAGEAIQQTPMILAALEKYFGMPYPYEKLDLIAVPEFWPGGMENPGAVTYAEELLLLDPATTNLNQQRSLATTTAHELAHMWFGDLVTMAWWDDLWLNESFASWMGDKVTHEVFPQYGVDVSQVQGASYAMITDARPSTRAIRRPVAATDNILQAADELSYNKGQAVLGMFEAWVGPETFRRGVRSYIKTHAWSNATASDFWSALTEASGVDFATTMATFLDQPGVPLISTELTLDGKVKLAQSRFTSFGHDPGTERWSIPMTLKFADDAGSKTQTILLTSDTILALNSDGPPRWVMPNAGASGYYRWTVPSAQLGALAENASQWLEAKERVGLVGNISALLDAGVISADDYLRSLNRFAHDADARVVSAVASGLEKTRMSFVTPELEDEYAHYVQRTLRPALAKYGWQTEPGEAEEVTRFRPRLLELLGDDGRDPDVLRHADSLAKAYLADPGAVDPALVNTVVTLAASHGDRTLFDLCRQRFETAALPRERSLYLDALGQFRDSALVQEALAYTLQGPLRPNEFFNIPFGVASDPHNEDLVFDWFLANYDAIMAQMPPLIAGYMPYMASGCSRERLAKAAAFFAEPSRNMPGTEETLAKVSDQVNDCAGLRDREGAKVAAYLKQFMASDD